MGSIKLLVEGLKEENEKKKKNWVDESRKRIEKKKSCMFVYSVCVGQTMPNLYE